MVTNLKGWLGFVRVIFLKSSLVLVILTLQLTVLKEHSLIWFPHFLNTLEVWYHKKTHIVLITHGKFHS